MIATRPEWCCSPRHNQLPWLLPNHQSDVEDECRGQSFRRQGCFLLSMAFGGIVKNDVRRRDNTTQLVLQGHSSDSEVKLDGPVT